MKMISRIQGKYRKSNRLILGLKVLFGILTIYFAVRVIFISISGLVSSGPAPAVPDGLFFGMMFCLGLSNIVSLIEMFVTRKKENFTLLFITTIFLLVFSAYILLV